MDTLIKIGQTAPDFELPDLDKKLHRLSDWQGSIVILNFWSAECPWAERTDPELLANVSIWGEGVNLCAISSNTNEPARILRRVAAEREVPLVLHDSLGHTADLYGALTTPHIFVIDREGKLRYQGAFDDVTFRQREPTRLYLKDAVNALLAGRQPEPAQTTPYGCAIFRHT
ncbi:MAG: redoxin domain-containing protein [Chloroflexota bacterium]|nr:redoxin domain-containing protein [Chloroflexota bacterium]